MAEVNMRAVITGDVVNSTKVEGSQYKTLMDSLKASFGCISKQLGNTSSEIKFNIFRGDGFQGVIPAPTAALHASLIIRSSLRKAQPTNSSFSWDARTAIGIGTIDDLSKEASEGTGEAYRYSGRSLDQMETNQRLAVKTPWKAVNNEIESQAALLDAVIAKWSPSQAEIVLELLQGKSRKEISSDFDISQAAVHYRIKGSGWTGIEQFLQRYENIMNKK